MNGCGREGVECTVSVVVESSELLKYVHVQEIQAAVGAVAGRQLHVSLPHVTSMLLGFAVSASLGSRTGFSVSPFLELKR
jgi:hypothetical protein